jgi:hypothetical protein
MKSHGIRELLISSDGRIANFGNVPDWSGPICFLIHGYNVEPPGAASAFSRFFQVIRRGSLLPSLLDSRSWLVYWQGYASGGLAAGKTRLSPLTYPAQIPSAIRAAQVLREFIDQRPSNKFPPQITFIAHSLGCRVVLELLDSYARSPAQVTPEFPLMVLMAAAVPIHFLEDLARLWRGALLPSRRLVLFSKKDSILAGPFRIGQTRAGEGIFPKAVGATGRPEGGFWSRVVRTRNEHSGYFDDANTAAEVAGSLGQAASRGLELRCETDVATQAARVLPAVTLESRVPTGQHR